MNNRQTANGALAERAAQRVAIENIDPHINQGRFAAKAVQDWPLTITVDVFGDGHELYAAGINLPDGTIHPMEHVANDRWRADVTFTENGPAHFTVLGWRDVWGTWVRDTGKKIAAGQDISVELQEARQILDGMAPGRGAAKTYKAVAKAAKAGDTETLLSDDTAAFMAEHGPRANLTRSAEIPVWVDRERAAFSAWYELFPRSQGAEGQHGTFDDVIDKLDYVTDLGFNILYFPPIHPIGTTNRKGKNNSLRAEPGDVGSPYAIGSPDGGMDAVHPELGTLDDFDRLVRAAAEKGLEIALDIALNASPDHPWIDEHPDWFERRPDGTIKFAENPPKKYEDIVNFKYYNADGSPNTPFWHAIRDLFLFWIDHGVTIFRVDNPHTKPFPFWEWIIADVRQTCPEAIFLSEAFTRPKLMKQLAKLGYNQSYTYYTWRNSKAELTEYLTELTTEACRNYMRPNFFTNTPDINPYFNHDSGRPGFRTRSVLAGTLSGNWGLYQGFEFCEADRLPPKDEYSDSEKYELKHRDLDAPGHIKDDVRLINRIRRDNPAMKDFTNLEFFTAHEDRVLFYGRFDDQTRNYLLFHVLLDPFGGADVPFELPLWKFGLPDEASIEVEDAVQGNRFTWHGKHHLLTLDPQDRPYAIWKLFPPGGAA
ncbi:alpha-1,4-glucan--maltose-1-phosphate maltosyltransferase [Loktanella sp. SALINAS62]|uniref:alpha-1,4-glucan--maltose-1-phosphate maltosyltransferase n=1 Tax=Loktanella sp. SALINAS62 TaxID=2706124 RepID=UPI001B8BD234|nr:alpha-1,4-glucan--maltose-1-phosphate maltosyltransferase [Loktanella sp. SALINAS62]MBS1302578.1 alpha-1,4-glucan--maltose-1-phosphate maltosyltransferase [Loktanella sp. SALINAS62]